MTGGSKLFIAAVAMLAITIANPTAAEHDHGGGGHGAGGGGGRHQAVGWEGGGGRHDNGRHLGWYKHGPGDSGWREGFSAAEFGRGWGGPGFVGPGAGWWDWRRAWGWSNVGWGWGPGA